MKDNQAQKIKIYKESKTLSMSMYVEQEEEMRKPSLIYINDDLL